jgi:hypothetical protein
VIATKIVQNINIMKVKGKYGDDDHHRIKSEVDESLARTSSHEGDCYNFQ